MDEQTPQPIPASEPRTRRLGPLKAALIGLGILTVGGGATAVAIKATAPGIEMAPVNPVPIASLTDDSLVTLRGRVAEIFGNKIILEDGSGRALVDLGRAGEDGALVAAGQTVTVQGRFDRGQVRASFLIDAAGTTRALGPAGPGGGKDKGPRGPERERERFDRVPPPAGAQPVAAPTTGPSNPTDASEPAAPAPAPVQGNVAGPQGM